MKVALQIPELTGGRQPGIPYPCSQGSISGIGKNECSMEHTLGFATMLSSWV